ncbi:unnamed protein product [Colias eurytheme]|nr:unnamed protein product [Colias eurytheme]
MEPNSDEVSRWRATARERLMEEWARRLENPTVGVRTVEAIQPVLSEWCNRRHGALTFRLTQVLSGHGCFGRYLCRVAIREPTMACHWCPSEEDTADHTLSVCPAWSVDRQRLVAAVGPDLSLPSVVRAMVRDNRSWGAVVAFCEEVMARKEEAERARERNPLADPRRRQRPSRRRRRVAIASDRDLPP